MGITVNNIHDCHAEPAALDTNRNICKAECCPFKTKMPDDWQGMIVYEPCPKYHTVKEN